MKHEKFKVTPLERAWILYDVGNSAFVLMIATLVPIFFNALAEAGGVSKVDYLAYWGYASSVVTVITAVLGPILGTLADTKNFKKPIFMLCLFVGVIGCCAMGLAGTWLAFLIIFIIAKIGYSGSLVFYDSMLGDVTTPERMDMVSSRGYAWGYIGSTVPFVICLALIMGGPALGVPTMLATRLSFIITGDWWLIFTLPLIRTYRQKYGRERGPEDTIGHIVGGVFGHFHGYQLRLGFGHRFDAAGAGAARYAVRGLSVRHHLRQARRTRGHAQHDPGGGRRLHGHCAVCRVLPKDRL